MNTLSLRTHRQQPDIPNAEPNLITEVLIDGQPLPDYKDHWLATNLHELWASTQQDGEFRVLTCTCGIDECAGIREGIRVYRDSKNVHWVVGGLGPTRTFSFEREAYTKAIEKGLQQLRRMLHEQGIRTIPDYNMSAIKYL